MLEVDERDRFFPAELDQLSAERSVDAAGRQHAMSAIARESMIEGLVQPARGVGERGQAKAEVIENHGPDRRRLAGPEYAGRRKAFADCFAHRVSNVPVAFDPGGATGA